MQTAQATHSQARQALPTSRLLGTRGTLPLAPEVVAGAAALAAKDFAQCVEEEFSGDAVRDYIPPAWLADLQAATPVQALTALGLQVHPEHVHLYVTCGVETHVDDMDHLSVAVVLYADGFEFRQGRTRLNLSAGDWFIFDDSVEHEVREAESATSLVILTWPARRLSSS